MVGSVSSSDRRLKYNELIIGTCSKLPNQFLSDYTNFIDAGDYIQYIYSKYIGETRVH